MKPFHPYPSAVRRKRGVSMIVYAIVAGLSLSFAPCESFGEMNPRAAKTGATPRKLSVTPSATSLAGGKARLILTDLTRQGSTYVGDYQLKVTPYFFKSEKGTLSMIVSDQSLLNLTQRIPVNLVGKATTNGSKKTRAITATAAPSTQLQGALKICVTTENGPLVFDTFYRFRDQ